MRGTGLFGQETPGDEMKRASDYLTASEQEREALRQRAEAEARMRNNVEVKIQNLARATMRVAEVTTPVDFGCTDEHLIDINGIPLVD